MTEDALRKTWEHIDLVCNLLMSAQIELMKRQATHDRSKLQSPEWEMFAEITHKLEGLTYGSEEYEAQRKEMLGKALGHHYEHNRHHPEFFESCLPDEQLEQYLSAAKTTAAEAITYQGDSATHRVYTQVYSFLETKQKENQSSVNNMNLFDILEMVIDWYAATRRHADGDINKSIEINTERFALSPQLVNILKNTIPYLDNKFEGLKTQKDI